MQWHSKVKKAYSLVQGLPSITFAAYQELESGKKKNQKNVFSDTIFSQITC